MMISDLLFRLRAVFRRGSVEKELDDELRFHFEHEVEKMMRAGLTREEASRRARLSLGGMDQVKEECRVLDAGEQLKILATTKLDGAIMATPALVDKHIYVRTDSYLYSFGK